MIEDLDLVEEDDQFTHMIHIDGEHKGNAEIIDITQKRTFILGEEMLNVFKPDEEFLKNEKNYETIKKEILGKALYNLQNITQIF